MRKIEARPEAELESQSVEEALEPTDFIKVEKNLTSLGFFTPTSRNVRKAKAKKVSFTNLVGGRREKVSVTIAPTILDEAPILPNTGHQDKYLAFQKIIMDMRQAGEEIKNPVGFSSAELVRVLGREKDGRIYKEISEWLDVMTFTGILSEGAVFFAGRKVYGRDRFHVFERSVTFGHEMPDGTVADKNYVWLSEWQLENINNNHLLPIDFESYKKLKNRISKALVPILQIWLYASKDEGAFEKRYDELCQYLNIGKYQHISKIKEKLSPALDELVSFGYLTSWKIETTSDDNGYKVILRHGRKFYQDGRRRLEQKATATGSKREKLPEQLNFPASKERKSLSSQHKQLPAARLAPEEKDELTSKLLEHGLHYKTAVELVEASPEEVKRQLEYLPYRVVKKNKGGLLREAILQSWTPPDEYLQGQKNQRDQHEEQERLKKKRDDEAKKAARQKTDEELKQAYYNYLRGKIDGIEREQPKVYSTFIRDSAAKRSALDNDPAHKGAAKKIHLRMFDDPESHLERARDFFSELAFDEWMKRHNTTATP